MVVVTLRPVPKDTVDENTVTVHLESKALQAQCQNRAARSAICSPLARDSRRASTTQHRE
jgi:hypothetical protein